jgi:hypothetical protein
LGFQAFVWRRRLKRYFDLSSDLLGISHGSLLSEVTFYFEDWDFRHSFVEEDQRGIST